MFNQLKTGILKEFRYYYLTPLSLISILINEFIVLLVFWYTAKAFVPNLSVFGNNAVDYFTFIIIGETVLRIPAFFITVIGRNIRSATLDGAFESHLLLHYPPQYSFIIGGISASIFEFIRVLIILLMAWIFFIFNISFTALLLSIPMQISSILIFSGIGLLSISILLILGRGEAWLMKAVSIATILAGAYFPTSIFPGSTSKYLYYISPFNLLLESSRKVMSQGMPIPEYLQVNGILLLWALVLFSIGYFSFSRALHFHKRRGRPFTYIS